MTTETMTAEAVGSISGHALATLVDAANEFIPDARSNERPILEGILVRVRHRHTLQLLSSNGFIAQELSVSNMRFVKPTPDIEVAINAKAWKQVIKDAGLNKGPKAERFARIPIRISADGVTVNGRHIPAWKPKYHPKQYPNIDACFQAAEDADRGDHVALDPRMSQRLSKAAIKLGASHVRHFTNKASQPQRAEYSAELDPHQVDARVALMPMFVSW